jgi:hypothetical protein
VNFHIYMNAFNYVYCKGVNLQAAKKKKRYKVINTVVYQTIGHSFI